MNYVVDHMRVEMSSVMLPWLKNPKFSLNNVNYKDVSLDYDVIVVGAGIAGSCAAFRLAEAGYQVLVLDKEEKPAQAGSGNRQGMLYLKLSPSLTYQNDLLIRGFEQTLILLQQLTDQGLLVKGIDWDDCGLIQLSKSEKKKEKQHELTKIYPSELLHFLNQEEASDIAGAKLSSGGLFFPRSGWVSPQSLVRALLSHRNITFLGNRSVSAIQAKHLSSEVPLWQVQTDEKSYYSKIVILAMADQVTQLTQCQSIPFTVVRGQTTTAKGDCGLSVVVSGEGYIAPSKKIDGIMQSTFGATFHRHQPAGNPTDSEHIENIEMLAKSSPEVVRRLQLDGDFLEQSPAFQALIGRASTRASAMGSIPIVGPIAIREEFLERFKAIRLDAKAIPDCDVPWELGLYLTTAHGSRGMITASIAADVLYDYVIENDRGSEWLAQKYSQELLAALHPNRFYYRELRFNQ